MDLSRSFLAASNAQGPGVEKEPSAFWKLLDYLDRFNSGAMGSFTALAGGEGDIASNYEAGFTGKRKYGGKDVLTAAGMDPDRLHTKALGLAMDILNPADPLNYIGVGAATKAGKAAKLATKLDDIADVGNVASKAVRYADDWGEATRLGQRGLLTFMGHRIPVPGDVTAMRGLQKTGQAIKHSDFGQAVNRLFGSRATREAMDPSAWHAGAGKMAKQYATEEKILTNLFNTKIRPEMQVLDNLSRSQRATLLDIAERRNNGVLGAAEALAEVQQKKLVPAWDALKSIRTKEVQFTGGLQGTGMAAWDDAATEIGHMPRQIIGSKPDMQHLTEDLSWKPASDIEDSVLNRALNQGSTQQRSYGINELLSGTKRDVLQPGQVAFDTVRKLNRGADDLVGIASPYKYSEDITKVINNRIAQNVTNINTDNFIEYLKKAGVAVDWDDAKHLPQIDEATQLPGKALYKKINQGRFAEAPVALPVEYEDAFRRYMQEIVSPENNYMVLGGFLKELQSWWKGLALFSAPSAYLTRNASSAFVKNYLEGLTPFNPHTWKYYSSGSGAIGDLWRAKGNINSVAGEITLPKSGVKVSVKRLLQEYFGRDMGGGGGFIGQELLEKSSKGGIEGGVAGAMQAARQKFPLFRFGFSANEKVEMGVRLPLALKVLDDTLVVARAQNKVVPDIAHALDDVVTGGFSHADVFGAAFENATEIVHRTHFDYSDLSPFEKSAWLRGGLVPFYAWTRKNIPHEITNMLTQPGKYMPFARAYYNAWEQSGSKPEDAPFWLSQSFAIPTSKDDKGRQTYLDMTNYLPMMDVVNAVNAFKPWGTDPRQDYVERTSRWAANQLSPFAKFPFEQGLSKDFFSGREMKEMPAESFGIQVPGGARTVHAASLVPSIGTLDRLNPAIPGVAPEGLWTKFGNLTGTFKGDKRPHRNEAPGNQRWLRFFTGLTQYTPDPTAMNMSLKARKRRYKEYINKAKRARREGLMGESRYYYELASKYRVS